MMKQKRIRATDSTDGAWQLSQLDEGWYTQDYDFSTGEFVMGRCEDVPTITPTQARLLSYTSIHDVPERHRRIIWPEMYEGE